MTTILQVIKSFLEMGHHGKENFFTKYRGLSDEEYNLELLYAQKITHGKLHKIRVTMAAIKWLLLALLFIGLFIIALMFSN